MFWCKFYPLLVTFNRLNTIIDIYTNQKTCDGQPTKEKFYSYNACDNSLGKTSNFEIKTEILKQYVAANITESIVEIVTESHTVD